MRNSTRRDLGALGIPPERHTREGLAELFPKKFQVGQSGLGIDAIGGVLVHLACRGLVPLPPPPAGHVCRFYRGRQELLDLLVPYFRIGLQEGCYCVWIASGPISPAEAEATLRAEVEGFDRRVADGQIEILSAEEFYLLPTGRLRPVEQLLETIAAKARTGLSRGFKSLRGSGDASWAARRADDLAAFLEYERRVDEALRGGDAAALCTYARSDAVTERLNDVIVSHGGMGPRA
jgi:hypothetical protein